MNIVDQEIEAKRPDNAAFSPSNYAPGSVVEGRDTAASKAQSYLKSGIFKAIHPDVLLHQLNEVVKLYDYAQDEPYHQSRYIVTFVKSMSRALETLVDSSKDRNAGRAAELVKNQIRLRAKPRLVVFDVNFEKKTKLLC